MIDRVLFQLAFGRSPDGPLNLPSSELMSYVVSRGVFPLLRGFCYRWRLHSCGRRLLVGTRTKIFFPSFISVGNHVLIGNDVQMNGLSKEGITLSDGVHLRERVSIQATSVLDHPGVGVSIGQNTYIGPDSILGAGGGIRIGSDVLIGSGVHVLAENHEFSSREKPIRIQGVTQKGITIGDDCWIGNQAIILDGVTIGKGSVIGAGSIVTTSISEYSVAVGSPARVVKKRGSE